MHLYVSLLAETRAKLRRATHIDELIRDWNSTPPDTFIFQTGVGTRALFTATDSLGLTDVLLRLLDSAQVVVRGPKPTTVLHSRKSAHRSPPAPLSRPSRCLPKWIAPPWMFEQGLLQIVRE